MAAVIDQLNPAQRQELLRLLIEDVQVTGWHVKIRLRIPLDDSPHGDHPRRRTPPPRPAPATSGTAPMSTQDRLRSLHVHERTQLPAQQKTRARHPHPEGGHQVKQRQGQDLGNYVSAGLRNYVIAHIPRPANECGQANGKLPRSRTDPDDAERDTGNYGSDCWGSNPSAHLRARQVTGLSRAGPSC